jgi:2-oxoisovalerate dehydrogenase E1 component beta subunit
VEQVPVDEYTLPLERTDEIQSGTDLTVVSYGTPLYTTREFLSLRAL